jgi:hypothetical protein
MAYFPPDLIMKQERQVLKRLFNAAGFEPASARLRAPPLYPFKLHALSVGCSRSRHSFRKIRATKNEMTRVSSREKCSHLRHSPENKDINNLSAIEITKEFTGKEQKSVAPADFFVSTNRTDKAS